MRHSSIKCWLMLKTTVIDWWMADEPWLIKMMIPRRFVRNMLVHRMMPLDFLRAHLFIGSLDVEFLAGWWLHHDVLWPLSTSSCKSWGLHHPTSKAEPLIFQWFLRSEPPQPSERPSFPAGLEPWGQGAAVETRSPGAQGAATVMASGSSRDLVDGDLTCWKGISYEL